MEIHSLLYRRNGGMRIVIFEVVNMMAVLVILSIGVYAWMAFGICKAVEWLWKEKLEREGIDWDDEFEDD